MKKMVAKVVKRLLVSRPEYRERLSEYLSSVEAQRLNLSLTELMSKGLQINTVFDIGARHGEWAKSVSNTLKSAKFWLFEANESCANMLRQTGHPYFIAPLSDAVRTVDFYGNDSTGDSYYKENTVHYAEVKAVSRTTNTLDAIVASNLLPPPDFLKIDTQGSELDILKGGAIALRECALIYIECPMSEYNLGAPKLDAYIATLKQMGFVPHDICEIHRAHGTLLQIDILFIKKERLMELYPRSSEVFAVLN